MTTDANVNQAPAPIVDATGADVQPNERDALKKRAAFMGIQHEDNIPTDKLRALVNAKMNEEAKPEQPTAATAPVASAALEEKPVLGVPADVRPMTQEELRKERRTEARKEALRLVRVIVTPNNPAETDRGGVLITVGNNAVGSVTQMVQFGEPWHVKNIVLMALQEKQFQRFVTSKDKAPQSVLAKAYSIEILPNLTEVEIEQLRLSQNAAKVGAV